MRSIYTLLLLLRIYSHKESSVGLLLDCSVYLGQIGLLDGRMWFWKGSTVLTAHDLKYKAIYVKVTRTRTG